MLWMLQQVLRVSWCELVLVMGSWLEVRLWLWARILTGTMATSRRAGDSFLFCSPRWEEPRSSADRQDPEPQLLFPALQALQQPRSLYRPADEHEKTQTTRFDDPPTS